MIQGHGGNIYAMARHLECRPEEILDMSSNLNPLGMPPGLRTYLQNHLEQVGVLPEVDSRTAIGQMAEFLDVNPERLSAGSGTTQFIYSAYTALKAEKVLIVGPTYSDYADACRMHQIEPTYLLAGADTAFEISLDRLERALQGMDTAFICNPNNPTGRIIPHEQLVELCRNHPQTHFIIDESYLPFVPSQLSHSMVSHTMENMSVLWSLSKIFGIPGLRAGFLVAHPNTIGRFQQYLQPWSLNSLAQAAVAYVGEHQPTVTQFIEESRRFLQKERQLFREGLDTVAQLTLFPSQVSYVLIQLPESIRADALCARMAQQRILIRNCGNFHGLSDRFIRVSLKRPDLNHLVRTHLVRQLQAGC